MKAEEKPLDRPFYVEHWLSDEVSDSLKNSALRYLKYHGQSEDLDLIEAEFQTANSKTSRVALEAIVNIQMRDNIEKALGTAITNQFDSFDERLIDDLLSCPNDLSEEVLRIGLAHRNERIKLECVENLARKDLLNDADILALEGDSSALVRSALVRYRRDRGDILNVEEIKRILVKPKPRRGFGALSPFSSADEEGQKCLDSFVFENYCEMPEKELADISAGSTVYDQAPYFAMCSKYFKKHANELRKKVDSKFKDRFESHIEWITNAGASEKDINIATGLEDFVRKGLTRKGLDVLASKKDIQDRPRIRKFLRSNYVDSSEPEIEYFARHGEWEDVPHVLTAKRDHTARTNTLLHQSEDMNWNKLLARVAYKIGKQRLGEICQFQMPSAVLVELVRISASSKFETISNDVLFGMLNNKDDKVRKFTALKCVQSFPKNRIADLLTEYVDSQDYRFYNVIFWLDFGVCVSRADTKLAANLVLIE